MAEQFDESPYTPEELAMLRTGEVTEIPAAQADQSLAMIYRKAAAFDVLDKLSRGRGVVEIYVRYNGANYDVVIMRARGSDIDSCGDELAEAILPLAKHIKEPTDAALLKQSKGEA